MSDEEYRSALAAERDRVQDELDKTLSTLQRTKFEIGRIHNEMDTINKLLEHHGCEAVILKEPATPEPRP